MPCVMIGIRRVGRIIERRSAKYKILPHGECIANPFNMGYSDSRLIWKVDWFYETVDVPFEYLTVSVPKNYDEILTRQYGDWHKMVKGGANHSAMVVDTRKSFISVLIEQFGYSESLLARRRKGWGV